MKVTKEEVLQIVLDNLSVQAKGTNVPLIDTLVRAYSMLSTGDSRPVGLDSGSALRDAPGHGTDEQWAQVKAALKGVGVPLSFNETRRTVRLCAGEVA